MTYVLKKGGKKQAFSGAKIRSSVEKAAKDAKVPAMKRKILIREVAEPVIRLFKKKRSIKATVLRKSILGRLDRKLKKVSTCWRRYEKKKRKKRKKKR
ncbi:MAG: hypothetical protein KKG60_01580 [Nanoarchaeota archaeon]|nr:hypothetical protein [Nanoarchaeota archaeon]